MPRKLRIEYAGAMYHVRSRGNRRQDIFLDDIDRHDFLKTLAEACQKTGWQVDAYCLMSNHYHVVLIKGVKPLSCRVAFYLSHSQTPLFTMA
jgi:REP element-mobilizing transposase RayT